MSSHLGSPRRIGIPAKNLTTADHKKSVGDRLRLAREALGLSAADLAKKYPNALTTNSKLHNYESGRSYPPPAWLVEFCDDYGLTTDYFYRGVKFGVSAAVADGLRSVSRGKSQVLTAERRLDGEKKS